MNGACRVPELAPWSGNPFLREIADLPVLARAEPCDRLGTLRARGPVLRRAGAASVRREEP